MSPERHVPYAVGVARVLHPPRPAYVPVESIYVRSHRKTYRVGPALVALVAILIVVGLLAGALFLLVGMVPTAVGAVPGAGVTTIGYPCPGGGASC